MSLSCQSFKVVCMMLYNDFKVYFDQPQWKLKYVPNHYINCFELKRNFMEIWNPDCETNERYNFLNQDTSYISNIVNILDKDRRLYKNKNDQKNSPIQLLLLFYLKEYKKPLLPFDKNFYIMCMIKICLLKTLNFYDQLFEKYALFTEILSILFDLENKMFSIKIGPLKTIERSFLKLISDCLIYFEEVNKDINNETSFEALNTYMLNFEEKINKIKIQDIFRIKLFLNDNEIVLIKLQKFNLQKKEKTFGDQSILFLIINDFVELQFFNQKDLLQDHQVYEIKRLNKIINEILLKINRDNDGMNIIEHCIQVSINSVLTQYK